MTKELRFYPYITVLALFKAEGNPQKPGHNDNQRITPREIQNDEFCPAGEEILRIMSEVHL